VWGGVFSVGLLKKLIDLGNIEKNDTTICYVTGNGLKATEVLMEVLQKPQVIQADVAKISAMVR
jgi:threonine synthase